MKKRKENYHYHGILHIRINLGSKFQLQETILIFKANFQKKKKRILPVENRKTEHRQ